jgi:hypothetical protein
VHDRGARHDALGDLNAIAFVADNEGSSAALALPEGDDDTALASLILGKATVLAVLFPILGANVATEVGTINLDLAIKFRALDLDRNGLA